MHKEWQVACLLCSNMSTMCLEYTDYSILRLKKHLLKRELRGQNQFSVIGRYFSQGLVFHSSIGYVVVISFTFLPLRYISDFVRSASSPATEFSHSPYEYYTYHKIHCILKARSAGPGRSWVRQLYNHAFSSVCSL